MQRYGENHLEEPPLHGPCVCKKNGAVYAYHILWFSCIQYEMMFQYSIWESFEELLLIGHVLLGAFWKRIVHACTHQNACWNINAFYMLPIDRYFFQTEIILQINYHFTIVIPCPSNNTFSPYFNLAIDCFQSVIQYHMGNNFQEVPFHWNFATCNLYCFQLVVKYSMSNNSSQEMS